MSLLPEYPSETMLYELDKPNPALSNAAVIRCCKAWKKSYRAQLAENKSEWSAAGKAGEAYRAAMPLLTTRESCRDFIACVAQGMLLGAIDEKNGGKLLYAAQVALAAANAEQALQNSTARHENSIDSPAKSSRSTAKRGR